MLGKNLAYVRRFEGLSGIMSLDGVACAASVGWKRGAGRHTPCRSGFPSFWPDGFIPNWTAIRSGLNEKTGRTVFAFEESASMNARSIPRRLSTLILKRLAEFPAHGLLGPRQVG
jgi:hypothetical protein